MPPAGSQPPDDGAPRPEAEPRGRDALADEIAALTRARDELSLLLDVSSLMAGSTDHESSMRELARFLVPRLADGCVVDVVDPDGSIRRLAVVVSDPAKADWAVALERVGPPNPAAAHGIVQLIRAAEAHVSPEVDDGALAANARDPDHLRTLRALAPRSALMVPLTGRTRPIGLLWLYTSESGRRYSERDLPMAQDLAGRAALALDNARLHQQAGSAIQARDDFLSIASHELRTPLTSMMLLIQSLARSGLQGAPNTRVPAKLELLERQGRRLTRLVEQMLDVARFGKGRIDLQPAPTDLSALARDVVEDLAVDAAEAGCRIDLSADDAVRGVWDPKRVGQVLEHLLSNAIKFGAGQPVEVIVSAQPETAVLAVIDHGIGIEPAHQGRIFDRLERAVSTRHYGGFGIGLWAARLTVDAMGGTIRVASQPRLGSTFTVELPRTARASVSPTM